MVGFLHSAVDPEPLLPFSIRLPHSLFVNVEDGVLLLKRPESLVPSAQPLALGCAWSVIPRNVEVCGEAACDNLARIHESLLRSLPVGTALQVLMPVLPTDTAPGWEAMRADVAEDPLLASQRAALRTGLPHRLPTSRGRLRAFATAVTLRVPLHDLGWGVAPLLQALFGSAVSPGLELPALLRRHLGPSLEQLEGLRALLDDTFLTAGHQAHRLTGAEVSMAVARGLDPLEPPSPVVSAHRPLGEQVLRRTADLYASGYTVGTGPDALGATVLSLQRAPLQTYPGMLAAPRAPADTPEPIALWQAYEGAFTVVANIAIVEPEGEKARAERKRFIGKAHAHYSQRSKDLVAELDALLGGLFLRGGQLLWGRIHLVVWGPEHTLKRAADKMILAARKLKLEFCVEADVGNTLFLQTLPLGFDPLYPKENFVVRARRISVANLVDLLPLYGAFQGTATPTIGFLNQRGEAVGIDFFDSPTNRHGVIVGTSGAGKSYVTAHIVNHMLGLGASGVIMDRLESYRELCLYWGGRYVEMDFNNPVCLNPFYGPLDNAHVAFIAASTAEMAGNGVERLDQEHKNVLAHAVSHFVQTYDRARGEPTLTPFVVEVLGDGCFAPHDGRARRIGATLARKLTMYMQGLGTYAGFVDGPNTLVLDSRLTVLEFSKLRNSRDLVGNIFFNLMHLLRLYYTAPERRYQRKFCVFEEVWDPLRYDETAQELDEAIRTFRRLYTSLLFVSNVLKDFASPVGEVIKALSAHKLFLQQESEELAQVQEVFALTDQEARVVGQVKKHLDFSSMYLKLGGEAGGQLYLVSDAYSRWMVSQQDQEKAMREARMVELGGMSQATLRQAVGELAERYPRGLEAAHA